MDKLIITIDREFGSGGHEVGQLLAEELGIKFYDDELINKIAQNTGFHEQYVRFNEEKTPEFTMGSFFAGFDGFQANPYDKIQAEEFNLIKQIAEEGSCVIVGRAADYILQEETHVSIFIFAPMEARIQRVQKEMGVYNINFEEGEYDEDDITKLIKNKDKQRRKYYEFYTENKWGSRDAYDLLINTDRTGIPGAAKIIKTYIETGAGKNLLTK